ncbi:MAG: 4Fe-4S dicluster domain-containing protein [Deltaproteobacteria bacterium]|nr:4Fe-4S dicluster domain-containing protein [Deltaproteobacteria bacterium]
MEKRLIEKEALAGIVGELAEKMQVCAPMPEEDRVLFRVLAPGERPLVDFANTKNAPKNFLFPRTETMMQYTRTRKGMVLAGERKDEGKTVLFGVRPCDARSFTLLDRLFDQEKYRDPYYVAKRAKTTVVALACVHPPYTTCFCTSVGGAPVSSEGVDLLLTDLGEAYLAEFWSPKGEALLSAFGGTPAGEAEEKQKEALAAQAAAEIRSRIPAREIKPILDTHFEDPFWDTLHLKCLACGTCTYLCPTCHCFDISDEVKGNDGIRIRNWDSCMFPMFTKETSGHNPRPSQKERWRQRVMHKFRYYVDNFGAIACVGCGRCVMACPVNLDIRKIVTDIAKL